MNPWYLDIETTSLYADTGMLVCAVLREGDRDSSFFVDSPKRERGCLSRLLNRLGRCNELVTFNGKSFDVPFIVSRALVLGIDNPWVEVGLHIDLYEECKRILRFDSNNLDHIARTLGIEVKSDMRGNDVPRLYIEYLSTRERSIKERLIAHCVQDVDTLQRLFSKLQPIIFREGSCL